MSRIVRTTVGQIGMATPNGKFGRSPFRDRSEGTPVVIVDAQVLRDAIGHAMRRNHAYLPEGCDGCALLAEMEEG